MTHILKIANVFVKQEQRQSNCTQSANRSVAETPIFSGVVYRVSVLWVDSQGRVTHALAHKQGFGPPEKITLIITGCIWTFPQREREEEGGEGGVDC